MDKFSVQIRHSKKRQIETEIIKETSSLQRPRQIWP